jgi:hypothetical protein
MVKKMNEIDVLNKALEEYEYARRLKHLNQELYDHLTGSIYYLIKQSEKYNIPLPNRDMLLQMIENTGFIIDQFAKPKTKENDSKPDQVRSDGFTHGEDPTESSQNPLRRLDLGRSPVITHIVP